MSGLYIHIPLCARKCIYCDFYSLGAKNAPWHEMVSTLLAEAECRKDEIPAPLTTIYIGGGTPSLLPPKEFERLAEGLHSIFDTREVKEFTVEVNPDDVTPALVEMLLRSGVNRVSMGVQSFHDAELRAIGRRHTAAQAIEAAGLLRPVGNVSMDLIFGLPGQTLESWRDNVERMLDLRPQHISAYSLMWESGTALEMMRRQGRLREVDEDVSARMFELLGEMLLHRGYEQYEISNYSLPGFYSRHNSSYWLGTPYLGLGPSAHSYDGERRRRSNPPDLRAYIDHYSSPVSSSPFFETEYLSDNDLREEYIMTRLRMARGIDMSDFAARFSPRQAEMLLRQSALAIEAGHLLHDEGRLHLSRDGIMLSDSIISSLF